MTREPHQPGQGQATVVLVHGAMHGSWCWERVIDGLDQRGIPSVAVDLPGRGANAHRPIGSAESAAVIKEAIDQVDGPVVVCAHSAGGPPMTVAVDGDERVRHLVYLAAFMPAPDQSMADLSQDTWAAVAPYLVMEPDGLGIDSADSARHLFYADCTAEDAAWAWSQIVREPYPAAEDVAAASEPTGLAPWTVIPTTYVVCQNDHALAPDVQRKMAAQAAEVVELPTGHSPFLAQPELVVDLLAAIARLEVAGAG